MKELHWNVIYKQNRGCRGLVKVPWTETHKSDTAKMIASKRYGFEQNQIVECKISYL